MKYNKTVSVPEDRPHLETTDGLKYWNVTYPKTNHELEDENGYLM